MAIFRHREILRLTLAANRTNFIQCDAKVFRHLEDTYGPCRRAVYNIVKNRHRKFREHHDFQNEHVFHDNQGFQNDQDVQYIMCIIAYITILVC